MKRVRMEVRDIVRMEGRESEDGGKGPRLRSVVELSETRPALPPWP